MTRRQIEKEVQRQATLFEEKVKAGLCPDTNVTLKEFCEKWFEDYAEPSLAPKTVAGYKDKIRRAYAALGHIRLDKLRPAYITEFYKNLRETGLRSDIKYISTPALEKAIESRKLKRDDLAQQAGISERTIYQAVKPSPASPESAEKIASVLKMDKLVLFSPVGIDRPLSDKTIYEYHRLLHVILKTAMQWQYLTYNPCDMVSPPKAKKKEAAYLDEVQTAQLLDALEGEPTKPAAMIKLLLYSGLRRGELCGLFWEDIDFDKRLLTVKRSTQYLPDKGVFDKDTKTEASKRTIKLPDAAFSLLAEYRVWQNEQRLLLGDKWTQSNRIFCDDYGKPLMPDFITQWLSRFVKRKGLPPMHIHTLRHTHATLMITGGVPLRTVSSRLVARSRLLRRTSIAMQSSLLMKRQQKRYKIFYTRLKSRKMHRRG